MEITVVGRHMSVPDRFRRHLEEKLEKVAQLAPRAIRVDVEISHENNPRQSGLADRVELTVHDAGSVIRSEARADDLYAALDVAYGRLLERLRRARDRRKDRRRGRESSHEPAETLRTMAATEAGHSVDHKEVEAGKDAEEPSSPVVIREKRHKAAPMTIDEALYEMELVGHDFYLFVDATSRCPKVVYRRKGWNYGVIELEVSER
ncbi:ribosome hibernation-promoting factor, HPF/YfiA family [Devriesea agamarum]|uniref:ribosome hibernation-promoting factor, HPF/YfiA family n=1 Tax=Devriesea agamarum TaxID=472569 RepID=UPI00071D3148|nr:ribosome-associated translation inhibitor RaiA [Devriesea agamarum]